MSREGFLVGMVLFAFLMSGVFLVSSRVTTWTSDERVNLPNKAYWLAPERRDATMRRIERHILRMGAATQAFLLLVFECVLRTNASGAMSLGGAVWTYLVVYSIVLTGLLVDMVREFARPSAG